MAKLPSQLAPSGKPINSAGWKVFFWLMALLTYFGVRQVPALDNLSLIELIDLGFTVITLIGIFGFAYYLTLFKVVFWRYFFYALLLDMVIISVVFPLLGLSRYGRPPTFGIDYLLELALSGTILYAVYAYAYKRPFIWYNPPDDKV